MCWCFLKKWFLLFVVIQLGFFLGRRATTGVRHAQIARMGELSLIQLFMALASWVFYRTRVLSLVVKCPPAMRMAVRVGFGAVMVLAHIAYGLFYIHLPDEWMVARICFFCVSIYIHTMILSLLFLGVETLLRATLPITLQLKPLVSRDLHTFFAVFLAVLFTAYGASITRRAPTVRAVDIGIEKLPEQFNGFSIILLTDIHIGPTVGRERVAQIVDIVNSLNADSVAIVGDLVDGFRDDLAFKARPLRTLQTKHGVFYATGNHEYYHSDVNEWLQFFSSELNFTVLHNANAVVKKSGASLCIAGVDDLHTRSLLYEGHSMDPVKALAGCPVDSRAVVLAHQPNAASRIIEAAPKSRHVDLILSGHTHAGQFYILWPLAYVTNTFLHGLYRDAHSGTQVYVSAGVNYWGPPVKMRNLCEIILIRLHPAA